MKPIALLRTIAVVELLAGAGLLIAPPVAVALLTGLTLTSAGGVLVARIAGVALAALALVCWQEARSARAGAPTALFAGLLAYNAFVPVLLVASSLAGQGRGIGLWAAVATHLALAACIAIQMTRDRAQDSAQDCSQG